MAYEYNEYDEYMRKRRKRKRKGYKLTVKKGKRKWTLRTLFKSKASRMRAKRGLASKGWK